MQVGILFWKYQQGHMKQLLKIFVISTKDYKLCFCGYFYSRDVKQMNMALLEAINLAPIIIGPS